MLENKDYCGQNIEDLLAEVGFPIGDYEFCFQGPDIFIKQNVSLYEAQKWLREEKKIYVTVGCPQIMNEGLGWSYEVCDKPWNGHSDDDCLKASGGAYDSYEEALSKGLRTAIEILKEN